MKYKGKNFYAIVATPGCGKSYLCDKYPNKFVDVDEVRLRCKYIVPEYITRDELERTKGDRPFARRANYEEYVKQMERLLDEHVKEGKILIAAPHPEAIDYLVKRGIKFAFVYQAKDMKEELARRMKVRGNSQKTIDELIGTFEYFYQKNINENQSVVKYEFGKDEFLENIIKKFGYKF